MMHPMLAVKQITLVDILNYTDTNDLYLYASAVVQWCERHLMKDRKFSYLEVIEIFLDHLNDSRYDLAIATCWNAAKQKPVLPV